MNPMKGMKFRANIQTLAILSNVVSSAMNTPVRKVFLSNTPLGSGALLPRAA